MYVRISSIVYIKLPYACMHVYIGTQICTLHKKHSYLASYNMHSCQLAELRVLCLRQVLYELTLRCGDNATTKMKENWQTIVPKLLKLGKIDSAKDQSTNALFIIDKQLRGSGTVAKLPAVFSFYKVHAYNY